MGLKLSRSEQPHKGDVQRESVRSKECNYSCSKGFFFIEKMDQMISYRTWDPRKHHVATMLRDEKQVSVSVSFITLAYKTTWHLSFQVKLIFNIHKAY